LEGREAAHPLGPGWRRLAKDHRSGEVPFGVALPVRLPLVLNGPEPSAPAKVSLHASDQALQHLAHFAGPEVLPHHFAFPLLLLAFALALAADGADRRVRAAAAVLVVVFWATLAARWPQATFPTESSPAKDELLRFVRVKGLDRRSLQLHTSWGTSYVAQLFGDRDRLLVYMRGATDDARRLETVRALAEARGRRILLVSSRRWDRLQTPAVEGVLGRPGAALRFGDWWAVEYDSAREA